MSFRSICWIVPWAVLGCGEPDVQKVSIPKPHAVPGFGAEAPSSEYRILGAMFPADNPVWFFKATGTASRINQFESDFDLFLTNLTFPDGPTKPPKWTVPETVKTGPAREFRFATLIYTIDGKPLELVVSDAKGGLAANLERWAGQVGAKTADVASVTKPITVGMVQGLKVSLSGSINPAGSRMMGLR